MNKIWFVSDTHFFHSNIIRFCKRPFENVAEMNDVLIKNWNDVVEQDDTVFHLGDFSFSHNKNDNLVIFNELKGNKVLIKGNHDSKQVLELPWDAVHDYYELRKYGGVERIVMFHYPMRSWNGAFHGSYHLFGHTHATIPDFNNSCDVGVDACNYAPVDIDNIHERMKNSIKSGNQF